MSQDEILKVLRMINTAESSLQTAKEILGKLDPEALSQLGSSPRSSISGTGSKAYESDGYQVIEGTFDGQNMIGPDDKVYTVAANYASKSKMVEGDRLKLTIMPNGSFIYKQIAPVEREIIKGDLISEDGHYKVLADGKKYRVILASVTYYKGEIGDEVTIVVPKGGNSEWAAIETIIPQVDSAASTNDSF